MKNPYQPPETEAHVSPTGVTDIESATHVRREFLNQEASVKALGFLFYIATVCSLWMTIKYMAHMTDPEHAVIASVELGVGLAVSLTFAVIGYGLSSLASWVLFPLGVTLAVGWLAFPIGTIICSYLAFLVFSRRGRFVFSTEYSDIMRRTAHVRYRMSAALKFILVLVTLFMVATIRIFWF